MKHAIYTRLAWWLAICNVFVIAPCLAATPVEIEVHFSPPWSFEGPDNTIIGVEPELLTAALRSQGFEPHFSIVSYMRLLDDFAAKKVPYASPMAVDYPGMTRTQTYLPYHDVAISLVRSKLRISAIADLADKRIVTYQAATKVLGPEFARMAAKNTAYRERGAREIQIEQLFQGRVDVVVGERRILTYLASKLHGPGLVQVHDIFPSIHYGGASWDPELARAVDRGMQKLRDSGEYQKIIDAPR